MKTATLLLSFALFTALPSCIAQTPAKAPPKEPFVVAAGELSLTDLIDRSAAYLDCNILVSPQELSTQNAVRLQKGISTDRDGCEEFLANMLYRNGLALTRMDEKGTMLEVIGLHGPRGREVASRAIECSPETVLLRPNLKLAVTTVVPLEHINATIASNALRPFFASTGQPGSSTLTIGNVGSSKAMLISGLQDQVAQAIRMLRKCDVPGGMDGMGMPGMVDERVPALERRVKALEDALGKQKPAGDSKPK